MGGAFLALIIITGSVSVLYYEYRTGIKNAKNDAKNNADFLHDHVIMALEGVDALLRASAYRVKLQGLNQYTLKGVMEMDLEKLSHLKCLIVADPEGRIVLSTDGGKALKCKSVNVQACFEKQKNNRKTGLYIGRPVRGIIGDSPVVPLSRAVRNNDGDLSAVIIALIDPLYFTGLFASVAADGNDRGAVLLEDTTLLASFPFRIDSIGQHLPDLPLFIKYLPFSGSGIYETSSPWDKDKLIVGYKALDNLPLIVVFGKSKKEALASFYRALNYWLAIVLFCLILDVVTLKFIIHQVNRLAGQTLHLEELSRKLEMANKDMAREIEVRRQTEEALVASEEKMRLIIESSPIGIRINKNGKYVYANPALTRIFGYDRAEEIVDLPLESLYAPEDRDLIIQRQQDRIAGLDIPHFHEFTGMKKNGELFPVINYPTLIDYNGEPAILCFIVDISTEKELRSQLEHAQRMEAVGTLAGGIAHDFNNLLQAVEGYTQILLLDGQKSQADRRALKGIERAVERASQLIRQLLTFSRKLESRLRLVDVNNEVRQVFGLLKRTFPKMINIDIRLDNSKMRVNADPAQIEQIIMNLCINARDAMLEGGNLKIETKRTVLDEEHCGLNMEAAPGDYICLDISDDGPGIDPQTMEHIFDPFYTTKEVGKGTGLGLAMVYGLVKNHGGHITCESKPGSGASFKVYLPAVDDKASTISEASEDYPLNGGSETIMVVDDEQAVREIAAEILERNGYKVMTCPSGEAALSAYEESNGNIDLFLMDLGMPGMGGRKCLKELKALNPNVNVVIASGYTAAREAEDPLEFGARDFIRKPYRLTHLLKTVRKVLDENTASQNQDPVANIPTII